MRINKIMLLWTLEMALADRNDVQKWCNELFLPLFQGSFSYPLKGFCKGICILRIRFCSHYWESISNWAKQQCWTHEWNFFPVATSLLQITFACSPICPLIFPGCLPPPCHSSRLWLVNMQWPCSWFSEDCKEVVKMSKTWWRVLTHEDT